MSKAPWVKLDLDFPTDDKMADLIVRHGAEGIGVYFYLLPMLSKAPERRLDARRIPAAAHAANVDLDRYNDILNTLVDLDLIQRVPVVYESNTNRNTTYIECRTLNKRLESYDARCAVNAQNIAKRWGNDTNGIPVVYDANTNRNTEENRIEKKREERRPPNTAVVKALFEEKGLPAAAAAREADKFVNHYKSVGWVVGKARTPMKDWRAAARGWYARMDNKPAAVNHNNWQ